MVCYARFHPPLGFAAVVLGMATLVLAPLPAFAQHGGGGHGGGGGGHFGGHFSGSHGRSSSQPTSPHSSARGVADSPPPVVTSRPSGDSAVPSNEFTRAPAHTTIGFPPDEQPTTFPALRSAQLAGPLSFSGEGHQIWQNTAAAPTTAAASLNTHLLTLRPLPPHIVRPPIVNAPYYPITFFPTFGFYGFGSFLGLGWGCGPLWGLGCRGYGGYGGYGLGYGYGLGGYYPPTGDDTELPPSDDTSNEPTASTWQNPPGGEGLGNNAAVSIPNTVIYLQNGTSYEVTDYWFADNKLHYVTNYGGENSVPLSQIDWQRTVDANAARGVDFTLHPAPPPSLTPPPSDDSAPPTTPQP
jgi:hypothetical protein